MNKDQALQVIEQALNISAQKGVFNLEDSTTVFTSLQILKQVDIPQYDLEKPTKMVGNKPIVIKEEK